jgi:hypothetical protein
VSIVEPPSAEKAEAQGIKGEFFIVEPNRTQLEEIGRLIDTGRLRAFVDTVLPLEHRAPIAWSPNPRQSLASPPAPPGSSPPLTTKKQRSSNGSFQKNG